MSRILDRLQAMGLVLPPPHPHTNPNRTACVRSGNVLYLSGHSSVRHAMPLGAKATGKVGSEISEDEARLAAKSIALVIMSTLQAHTGDLDKVTRVIRLFGMVNSAPGFERQFAVMDGASDLFYELWGPDKGCHAPAAVGIAELPRRAIIEISGEFELAPSTPGRPCARAIRPMDGMLRVGYAGLVRVKPDRARRTVDATGAFDGEAGDGGGGSADEVARQPARGRCATKAGAVRVVMTSAIGVAAVAVVAVPPAAAGGEPAYPTRPIRFVVGFTAGGAGDSAARVVGQRVAERLGQSPVIDNRAWAGGNIATELVARAAPDGHTMLLGIPGPLTITPNLESRMAFDPEKDFQPVTQVASTMAVLLVHPAVANSVSELSRWRRPGRARSTTRPPGWALRTTWRRSCSTRRPA